MRHADLSLICVATHIGAISIIRRWICLRFSQVHVHCNICLDVGSLHSATGPSYLALAQNLTIGFREKSFKNPKKSSKKKLLRICVRIYRIFTVFKNVFPPRRGEFGNSLRKLFVRWATFCPLGSFFWAFFSQDSPNKSSTFFPVPYFQLRRMIFLIRNTTLKRPKKSS